METFVPVGHSPWNKSKILAAHRGSTSCDLPCWALKGIATLWSAPAE